MQAMRKGLTIIGSGFFTSYSQASVRRMPRICLDRLLVRVNNLDNAS